ncbi:MAG: dihydroneopterin aldolase, partial [Pseudomonadota bacterium]|nr:dihydroneopterin aldolase [Pseudomonadota bacterium]
YAKVAAAIDLFAAEARFELVETFAERLAQRLMSEFGILWLRLRVTKPGVNARARALGVEIERGCR